MNARSVNGRFASSPAESRKTRRILCSLRNFLNIIGAESPVEATELAERHLDRINLRRQLVVEVPEMTGIPCRRAALSRFGPSDLCGLVLTFPGSLCAHGPGYANLWADGPEPQSVRSSVRSSGQRRFEGARKNTGALFRNPSVFKRGERESNPRVTDLQSVALATWLPPQS